MTILMLWEGTILVRAKIDLVIIRCNEGVWRGGIINYDTISIVFIAFLILVVDLPDGFTGPISPPPGVIGVEDIFSSSMKLFVLLSGRSAIATPKVLSRAKAVGSTGELMLFKSFADLKLRINLLEVDLREA
jgi:hypothetical protein